MCHVFGRISVLANGNAYIAESPVIPRGKGCSTSGGAVGKAVESPRWAEDRGVKKLAIGCAVIRIGRAK